MKHLVIASLLASAALAGDGFTVPVRTGDCREQVLAQGELRAASTASIHAPEMEESYLTVKSVAENGAAVKAGDVVLEFDDVLYQLALKAATQDVALKKAQRDLTKFQLDDERIKSDIEIKRKEIALAKAQAEVVRDTTIVSQVDMKKAELSVELAQLELAQARSARQEFEKKYAISLKVKELELDEAQRKLDHATKCLEKIVVRAPKDGVVYKPFVRLNNEKGRVERNKVVRPGDKLLEIPNFDKFEGVVNLPAADVRFVQTGDPVTLRLTMKPDRTFKGTILRKDPYPMTRNERLGRDDAEGHLKEFEVVIALDARDPAFRPGATFTATVDVTLAKNAVFVPAAAVHTEAGKTFVYTPVPGGPARTPVTVGAAGYSFAVITAGLSAGQSVLLDGGAK
jgi:biotin carboxyl carrier protein